MIVNPNNTSLLNLLCEICFNPFDLENCLPKSLPCCGKSLCRNCLQDIQRKTLCECPWCRARIPKESEAIKTNLQLFDIIEEDSKWEKCSQHGESMKLVCLQDKCKLCAYCGLSSECKNHDLVNLVDLKNASDERIKELKESLETVEEKAKRCDEIINKNRRIFQEIINENFEKQIFELRKVKTKTLMEINSAFNEKRKTLTQRFDQQHVSLRDEVQTTIFQHLSLFKAKDPISLVQEDMSNLKARIESLMGGSQEINNFEEHLAKMAPLFGQKGNDFDKLINGLKGEMSQKEFFENVRIAEDEADEIQVEVSELYLQCHDGTLKCGDDMRKPKKMASFKLKELREIDKLILITEGFDLIEINLKALESIFAKIVKISQISLFLESTSKLIPLEKLAHLFSIIFEKPQDLENLTVFFPPNNDLLMMFNVLMPQFSKLKDLKILFSPGKYNFNACEDFAQSLSPGLEKLDLNFSDTNFPTFTLEKVFISMPNLEEFILNLRGMDNFNDSLLEKMTNDLRNLMPKLRKFKIDASKTSVSPSFASTLRLQIKFIPDVSIHADIAGPSTMSSELSRRIARRTESFKLNSLKSQIPSNTCQKNSLFDALLNWDAPKK